jgi:hypothetical protein
MKLKNYTSSVPVDRTLARIETLLAEAGASHVMKDYLEGRCVALSFRVATPATKPLTIRLPANAEAVFEALRKQVKRPREHTIDRLHQQAGKVAWKLMQDWVEVQLTLIQLQQAEFLQVFLPYVWDGEQTFYERLRDGNFKALPEHVPS